MTADRNDRRWGGGRVCRDLRNGFDNFFAFTALARNVRRQRIPTIVFYFIILL